MKKIVIILCLFSVLAVSGQSVSKKVVLTKGQQLEQLSKVNMNMTQEMMGQTMDMKMESTITSLVEVKDDSAGKFEVANTLKKVLMNMSTMGQDMKFDSEKKEDLNGQMGEAFKGKLNKPREFTVNNEGIITAVKTKEEKKEDAGGMMGGLMSGVADGEEKEGTAFNALANIPSKGAKLGESWTDTTSDANGKNFTTYTLKEVNGNNGVVTMNGNLVVNREMEQSGMTMQMDMKGTISGEYTFEVGTGIITSRKAVTKVTGTVEAGGQSIPITIETTTTTTVIKK